MVLFARLYNFYLLDYEDSRLTYQEKIRTYDKKKRLPKKSYILLMLKEP